MKNRKLKLGLLVGLVAILVLIVAALAINWSSKEDGSIPVEDLTTGSNSTLKVGFLIDGAIGDPVNIDIYNDLKKSNQSLGASVSYEDNTTDPEAFLKRMGDEKATIVFVKAVAGEYKNTYFIVLNASVENGGTLGSIIYNNDEVDFVQGALATLLSSNNTVGFLAGGSRKINPDARFYGNVKDREGSLGEIIQRMSNVGVDIVGAYGSEQFLGDALTLARQNKLALVGNGAIDFEKNKDVVIGTVELKAEDFVYKTIENANKNVFTASVQ